MHRFALVFLFANITAVAQNPGSDPQAISLAQQSVAALNGGANITDVTLNANVTSILGSDYESGTATLLAKGTEESRVDLTLNTSGTRADVRNSSGGAWEKNGGTSTAYAQHNCWVDAPWFFPALSSLTQTTNQSFVFKYIGQEQHGGVNTQHIQVFQAVSDPLVQHLGTMDFYLDPNSQLPLAIAFTQHPDENMSSDIAAEIEFADYRSSNGIQVPYHIQRMLNGLVVMDIIVTSAAFNSSLPDSQFQLT